RGVELVKENVEDSSSSVIESRTFKYECIKTMPRMPPPDLAIPFLGTGLVENGMPSLLFMDRIDHLVGNYGIGLVPLF
ncbi:MAG: hypothetical protein WC690_04900, partial [bacterium]